MSATTKRPLRVIQWTTGNIGRRSLHAIIGRPDMELVGVFAHGADKVGVDAAELAGWPEPTGITATNDIDALLATKPDACCYNPLWPSIDELERLLGSGVNVCTSAAWITGGKQTAADLDRIRKACERGNSTIFGNGAHPGMTNMVAMVLSGSCERVDEIRITESVDCSTYESAGTQTAMGFSCDPDTPGLAESVRRESEVFAESAAMMADAARYNIDRGAQIIDINMGCPAKKVCNKWAGSALMQDEPLALAIVQAVVAACAPQGVPVTLKMRTGWSETNKNAVRLARAFEDAGVQMIAVHGRTREQGYKGLAEYDTIAAVKAALHIPVVANGDIDSPEKARDVLAYTGADAVMVGRAAQGRPWIFREISHFLDTGTHLAPPLVAEVNSPGCARRANTSAGMSKPCPAARTSGRT